MSEALFRAVEQRLASCMPGWTVESYPDDQGRFRWAGASSHLLVAPEGSTFAADPESTDPLSLEETVRVSITVLVRSLRGELGAVTALTEIRRALFGWRPELDGERLGFGPVVPERSGFVSEAQGVWRWVIVFRCETVAVANASPLSGPAFKTAEFR